MLQKRSIHHHEYPFGLTSRTKTASIVEALSGVCPDLEMKQVQNAWDYMKKKNSDILSEFKPSSTSNDRTGAVTVEAQKHYEAQRLAASWSKDEVHWKALADNFVVALDERFDGCDRGRNDCWRSQEEETL